MLPYPGGLEKRGFRTGLGLGAFGLRTLNLRGSGLQGVEEVTERLREVFGLQRLRRAETFGGRNDFRVCDLAPTSWKITGFSERLCREFLQDSHRSPG